MRKFVTPDILAGEIKMARKSYPGAFAVVEGSDDARIYSNFIDPHQCVFKVAHSKDKAIETVAKFADSWGVFGIVDADDWKLTGRSVPISHVFFTDTHDAETMIIKSNAFEKFLRFRTHDKSLQRFLSQRRKDDLRTVLLLSGKPIGYLRIINNRAGYGMKFKGLYFRSFVCKRTLAIDVDTLIACIRNNTSAALSLDDDGIREELSKAKETSYDLWSLVCGHDLADILTIGLNEIFGHRRFNKTSSEEVKCSLRLAFEKEHFQQTALYSSVKNWEENKWKKSFLK